MSRPALFDFPLHDLQLIEASAGTGKTWTISGLFVRLLLEGKLSVEQILVVTYTKAATAELRDRLRQRLVDVRTWLATGTSDDVFGQALLQDYQTQPQRNAALQQVEFAIRGFDHAAIYTIHGFCQRVLTDAALEAGVPFEQELLADDHALLFEVVADAWRNWVADGHPALMDWLASHEYTPQKVQNELGRFIGKPYLQLAGVPVDDLPALWSQFEQAYLTARPLWLNHGEDIAKLMNSDGLSKTSYKAANIADWLSRMDTYLAPEAAHAAPLFKEAVKFTPEALEKATKKGQTPPVHAFFDAMAQLLVTRSQLGSGLENTYKAWLGELLQTCNTLLPQRKASRGVLSFDDLLNRLAEALQGPAAAALVRRVNDQFKAALIDEFQDTDPVQYQIFNALYGSSGLPVYLVGDPKQAIYSFRGADIFTYLDARRDTRAQHTLGVNQRSDHLLVKAVNALFERPQVPFAFDGIHFDPVDAKQEGASALQVGDGLAPMCISLLPDNGDDKPISKEKANEWAAEGCASEIVRLLNLPQAEASLKGRPLNGGDMAILVPSHRQGRQMMQALQARGVAAVQQATDSVFNSPEAMQLATVLAAILSPASEKTVSAALTTELFGLSGEALFAEKQLEVAWEARLAQFGRYHELWKNKGFMPMARLWLDEENLPARLLAYADGERRLTNLLHLLELIQTESVSCHGMDPLYQWYATQCQENGGHQEETQIRLESDAHRVRIVTIHASKGLEYPIVFCPFAWDGALTKPGSLLACRNPAGQPTLYLDADETIKEQVRLEQFAEKLRLLYVALTRAKHRCYLTWGACKDQETAALGWLLHPQDAADHGMTPAQRFALHVDALKKQTPGTVMAAVMQLCEAHPMLFSAQPVQISPSAVLRQEIAPQTLSARQFGRTLRSSWYMSSFTAMTRHVSHYALELPDHDAMPLLPDAPAEEAPATYGMFDFPRGARPGTFLHSLFEETDFTQPPGDAQDQLIKTLLTDNGYGEHWLPVLRDMLNHTLAQPLDAAGHGLRHVSNAERLVELEFTFPQPAFPLTRLADLLTQPDMAVPVACQQAARQLDAATSHGYMKGFMDLVCRINGKFYVVDYKSNWLGNTPAHYQEPYLTEAIAAEHYYLQYLIYTLALHRYLKQRIADYDYDQHMGGVRYLFLRGTATGLPGCGVYHDRPVKALIEGLDALFGGRP
ncbi:exodeoxyribonuclease V subunit beta [Leeia oryzae]|uniref:exodeoxyribonuclease V subunit beta n=1 Tax=Leeia oryzae TaxID=356662 RepID=UPI000363D6AD|nr:exodeoxyribonuclease V subunit beta [Leeia oryzae]